MQSTVKIPSKQASREARGALQLLSGLPRARRRNTQLRIRPEGASAEIAVALPEQAFEALLQVLEQMASGNLVAVVSTQAELTTQQAADLLNVSRPHLVALLERDEIPHRMVGTHRRVRVADLQRYKARDDAARDAAAQELAAEAQRLGLGY